MVGKFARTALISLALAFGGVSASPSCEHEIVESSIVANGTIVQLSLTNTTSSAWAVGQQFKLDLGSPNLLDIGFDPENSVEMVDMSENIYTFKVRETPNDSMLQIIAERKCSQPSDGGNKDDSSTGAAACSKPISVVCKDGSQPDSTTSAANVLSMKHDNTDDSEFGALGHRHYYYKPPLRCGIGSHKLTDAAACHGGHPYGAFIPPNYLSRFPSGPLKWESSVFIENHYWALMWGYISNSRGDRFKVYLKMQKPQYNHYGFHPFEKNLGQCKLFDSSSWYFYHNVRGWLFKTNYPAALFTLSNVRPAQLGFFANLKNGERGLGLWLKASYRGHSAPIEFNSNIKCR